MQQAIRYSDGLKEKWSPCNLPLSDFLNEQEARWGDETFQRFELLQHTQKVILYYDFDKLLDRKPTPQELQQDLQLCLDTLTSVFEADPDFQASTDILYGHRHGYIAHKRKHKVSYRFWIPRYHALLEDLPKLNNHYGLHEVFDPNVYHSSQKLGIPGACKGGGDTRVLELGDKSWAEWCLAQRVPPDSHILEGFPDESIINKYKGVKTVPEDWEEVRSILEEYGFTDATFIKTRETSITFSSSCLGSLCPCGCGGIHTSNNFWVSKGKDARWWARNYSLHCKTLVMVDSRQLTTVQPAKPCLLSDALCEMGLTAALGDGANCQTVRQHLKNCPSCSKNHDVHEWLVETMVSDCYTVRNVAIDCPKRFVGFGDGSGDVKITNPHLESIFDHPKQDFAFAQLFLDEHAEQWYSDGIGMYKFLTGRWTLQTEDDVKTAMQSWLSGLFIQFNVVLAHESLVNKFARDRVRTITKRLQDAHGHLKHESSLSSILKTTRRILSTSNGGKVLDANPNVLGMEGGGLVDLQTCECREATAADMVSKSVGYAFLPTPDPAIMQEVEECMTQIYPEAAERQVAQMFGGYSLLGDHICKKFALFTDAGGNRSGNNAKSTFAKALHATMGPEYSMKGKNELLYKVDHSSETVNSHSSGLLAYRGYRMAYFEELEPKRRLGGILKDINGSCAKMQGRAAGSSQVIEFEWITKQLLITNQGSMPEFDFTDTALVDRMLVLQHRSRFCTSQEEYEQTKHIPNTFLSNPNMTEKLMAWRPYLLLWFLEGLKMYRQNGFAKLPAQCQQWRRELVGSQDTVGAFVAESVKHTGNLSDFVDKTVLYQCYTAMYPEERNKKTALGKRKFEDQLLLHMGTDNFYEGPKKIPGAPILKRKVWLGFTVQ